MSYEIIHEDCRRILPIFEKESIDVIVTSPPYNLNQDYDEYFDNKDHMDYLQQMEDVFALLSRCLKPSGSFFLNMGFTSKNPWIAMDVAREARVWFTLQNHFCWVKSITLDAYETPGLYDGLPRTYGHFQPINSPRYVNQCWEHVFHFTQIGEVPIDRLALGVPYEDKSNLKRGTRSKNGDLRCRGNTWFIPYQTVQNNEEKGNHPAVFPEQLVEWCLRLHGIHPDMVVLDPFMGTGTTLKVAQDLGVKSIGIDVSENYCRIAREILG